MSKQTSDKDRQKQVLNRHLEQINLHAAGIDIGGDQHWVAVPPSSSDPDARKFGAFTKDLYEIANWLQACEVETVAMESTGVYWIPLFEVLEERGFEVKLVDARKVKNVSGRKSDLLDCQWIQQLHTYGLLSGAFRPPDEICVLRSLMRQREMLIKSSASHIQHMQKALQLMNVRLDNVVSDITGQTGMAILKAILAGERDPQKLAEHRDHRCKNTAAVIAQSLIGNYRPEHLFALKQAVELFEYYQEKILECEREIEQYLKQLPQQTDQQPPPLEKWEKRQKISFNARDYLFKMTGVDLFAITGLNANTLMTIYSETGGDMSRWPSGDHFASWLCLCPGTKKSGGKVISGQTLPNASRAATAFRQAAVAVGKTNTSLGAFYRRKAAQKSKPVAVTATAHKLARLYYSMLKHGQAYVEESAAAYEEKHREQAVSSLKKKARSLGFELAPVAP
ncbi:MAG: IS110 family transposase [Burkholderiales bacterium]